jgi:tRNA A-37 threonylcarbamoyl transferase component Bud32
MTQPKDIQNEANQESNRSMIQWWLAELSQHGNAKLIELRVYKRALEIVCDQGGHWSINEVLYQGYLEAARKEEENGK